MPISHFESLVEKAMRECEATALRVTLGDSHKLAQVQGHFAGLKAALGFYRDAAKADLDPDGA